MALETVQVVVTTDDLVPLPVEGVVVRVFDVTGSTFITSATTDVSGVADLTLDGGVTPTPYQLRFFVVGGSIKSPQSIGVYSPASGSPTGTNRFGVTASLFTLPPAVDPRLCRASGRILRPDGKPLAKAAMEFIADFNPVVSAPDTVLGERVNVRSDKDGYVEIDLFRGASYFATVEGHHNIQREILVPDRASVNIGDLLFPVVLSVTWSLPGPWSVGVNQGLQIAPTVQCSDFRILPGAAQDDVEYVSSNPGIVYVSVADGGEMINVRGVAPGSAQVLVRRRDLSIVRNPDAITGAAVTVNVS